MLHVGYFQQDAVRTDLYDLKPHDLTIAPRTPTADAVQMKNILDDSDSS